MNSPVDVTARNDVQSPFMYIAGLGTDYIVRWARKVSAMLFCEQSSFKPGGPETARRHRENPDPEKVRDSHRPWRHIIVRSRMGSVSLFGDSSRQTRACFDTPRGDWPLRFRDLRGRSWTMLIHRDSVAPIPVRISRRPEKKVIHRGQSRR